MKRLRGDEGVAAVELALVLPVFLALVFAGIDFALAFREQVMLRNAAGNAAAYATEQPCAFTPLPASASSPEPDASGWFTIQHDQDTVSVSTGALQRYIWGEAADEIPADTVLRPADADIQVKLRFLDSSGNVLSTNIPCTSASKVQINVSAPYTLFSGYVLGLFGTQHQLTVSGQETAHVAGRT